jgi:DNA polymerase-3 subunit delta
MAASAPLLPVFLIVGNDRPKVRRAVQRLRQRVVDESGSDLNISTFVVESAGTAETLRAIIDATATPGFALGTRLLLVLGVHHFRAGQRKELVAYLQDPMPDTCLALEAEKLAKDDPLYKAVVQAGKVLPYNLPKKYQMAGWVTKRAKAMMLPMSPPVARHLLHRCGEDPRHAERLEREIEKLAIYCRGEAATEADVDAICTPDDDARIFDLMDAVGLRHRKRSFALLQAIYASGDSRDDANGVLYSLKRHVERLDAASQLPHADQSTAAKQLGVHPVAAGKLLEQRENYDRRRLGRAYRALAEAEAGLRGRAPATLESAGGVNDGDRLVVELALARLLA